jgi:hypothetical protein
VLDDEDPPLTLAELPAVVVDGRQLVVGVQLLLRRRVHDLELQLGRAEHVLLKEKHSDE